MSRQLSLIGGKPMRVNSYFRNPVSDYEKFVNKHWNESGYLYASKQKFMEITNKKWKSSSPQERENFMKTLPKKQSSVKVTSFFKHVPKAQSVALSPDATNTPLPSCSPDKPVNSTPCGSSNQAHAVEVTDTFLALTDREKYLQSKERLMISTLFSDFGLNDDNPFFTEDIVNDPDFLMY